MEKVNIDMETKKEVRIPENEMRMEFVRSGGAGGQNVNKVASKVKLWWSVGATKILNDEEKERVRTILANRINENDELLIESQETRSQLENKKLAIERLHRLVESALVVPKERIDTEATRGSVAKRLEEKEQRGRLKEGRKKIKESDLTEL